MTGTFVVANLTDEAAARDFEVTNELSAGGGSYVLPQRWAAAFDVQGFGGIEYRSRFVTKDGAGEHSVAVFGAEKAGNGPFVADDHRSLTEAAVEAQIPIRRKPAAVTNVTGVI